MASNLPTVRVSDPTPGSERIILIIEGNGYEVDLRQVSELGMSFVKSIRPPDGHDEAFFGFFKYMQQSGRPWSDLINDTEAVNTQMQGFEATYTQTTTLSPK